MFYEAATVLTAFVLLGHWFEMRAAVAPTMRSAPCSAGPADGVVLRDGHEAEVPTADVPGR